MPASGEARRTIPVTVVATVRDEAETIGPFLRALERQTRPPDEVVLVDGGSTDGTLALLEDWARRAEVPVSVHQAPGSNIAAGRNIAIRHARSELIAVTDAGTVADERWLERLCAPFEHNGARAVSGFYVAGGQSWFGRCLTTVITPQLPEIDPARFLPSSRSVAFRKDAWIRAGGYPEWLDHSEDLVFDRALLDSGARFVFAPDALVRWEGRPTLGAYARQYFLYARGDAHALLWPRRHAARYGAYLLGGWLLARSRRDPMSALALTAGMTVHWARFWRRLRRSPVAGSRTRRAAAYALVPVIVVTGDVAKMAGYAVGRVQRARKARGSG